MVQVQSPLLILHGEHQRILAPMSLCGTHSHRALFTHVLCTVLLQWNLSIVDTVRTAENVLTSLILGVVCILMPSS